MNILAICGSTRTRSTNLALLMQLREQAPCGITLTLDDSLRTLPIFNPDREGDATPDAVTDFCRRIAAADALIIASPEYVHAIPGGLKNAIDWLVSREEIMHKPVALGTCIAPRRGHAGIAAARAGHHHQPGSRPTSSCAFR